MAQNAKFYKQSFEINYLRINGFASLEFEAYNINS